MCVGLSRPIDGTPVLGRRGDTDAALHARMTTISVSALIAFVIAACLTPAVRFVAIRHGAFDVAGTLRRKVHAKDVPRLGGIAIVLGFYAPLVGLLLVESSMGRHFLHDPMLAYGMLGGGVVIAALGVADDIEGVSVRKKFLVQILVAVAVVALGFRIRFIALPSLPVIDGVLVYPLSIVWIVGLTNAINLIDGLDGLAAGLAVLGLIPVVVIALVTGNLVLALLCCTLAASALGFLLFNFYPARIFMGDCGSMFLGFTLSLVTVQGSAKGPLVVSLLAPILALGLPIMDTLLALSRRALLGRPLFAGDDEHIHHRLRRAGLSHRGAVLTMYAVALLLAIGSLCILLYRQEALAVTLGATAVICAVLMRWIGYLPLRELRGVLRSSGETRVRNRGLYLKLRELSRQLQLSPSIEHVRRFSEQLGLLVGARGGTLHIAEGAAGHPAAVAWEWGEPLAVNRSGALTFRIRVPQTGENGVLEMIVAEPERLDAGRVGIAEHGCVAIGRALTRCACDPTVERILPAGTLQTSNSSLT